MQFCGKEKRKTSGLILLVISAILLISCCFSMNADAATGKVDLMASDYSEGTHNGAHATEAGTMKLKAGNALGYKLNFESEATSVTIEASTNAGAAGTFEIRLDSKTGPLLATIQQDKSGSWTRRTQTAKIDYEFSGQHTIWFVFTSGQCDFHTISFWIPGANGGLYPEWPGADSYEDISSSEYREEINMLKRMKAFGDGDGATEFRGKIAATRAEFAVAMANLFDVENGTEAADIFSDIKKDDAFCSAVTELLHLNIVKANTTTFRPTDYITYDEAAEWMVAALGLEYQVKSKNLSRVIDDMNLFYEIAPEGKYVTREQMAKMLVNTIQAENAVLTEFMPNDWYKFEEGDGILSYQGIYRGRGVVEANGYYSLYTNDSTVSVSEVIIDGESYNIGKTNAPNYVGFEVDYLYQIKNNSKTIIGIMSSENSSSMLLDSESVEITEIDERLITYYPDDKANKEKEIELDSDTIIFYNDKLIDDDLDTLLGSSNAELFDGTILLINNDDNNKDYEIVRIYHIESIIFGGFNGNSIHDKLRDEHFEFSALDDILIYDNGSLAETTAVPYETVIDVYRSKNSTGTKIFRGIIANSDVEGYVIREDSDGKITLDNNGVYEIYKDYHEDIEVGQEGRFLLNSIGKILGVKAVGTDYFGLMRDAGLDDPTSFNGGSPMVRLYLIDSDEEAEFGFAKNVYVDGVRTDDPAVIYNAVNAVAENTPIRYRLDDEKKIVLVDTPTPSAGGPRDCLTSLTGGAGQYKAYGNVLMGGNWNGLYPVSSKVTWLDCYTYEGQTNFVKRTGLQASTENRSINLFTTVQGSKIGNLAIRYMSGIPDSNRNVMVVTEVYKQIENGEEWIYVKGLRAKDEIVFRVDKEVYAADEGFRKRIDGMEKGDTIIPYSLNTSYLRGLDYLFMGDGKDANECGIESILNKDTEFQSLSASGKNGDAGYTRGKQGIHVHGTIIDREGDFIQVRLGKKGDADADVQWVGIQSAGIIVCDGDGRIYSVDNKESAQYLGVGEHVIVAIKPWAYVPDTIIVYRSIEFDD